MYQGKSRVLKHKAVPSLNLPSNRIVFDCEKREIEEKSRQRENRIHNREAQAAKTIKSTCTDPLVMYLKKTFE